VFVSVCNVTALLQCLTLIRQHQLTTATVTIQDLKIADYGTARTELDYKCVYAFYITHKLTSKI